LDKISRHIYASLYAVFFPVALISGSYDPSFRERFFGYFGPHSQLFTYSRHIVIFLVLLLLVYLNRNNTKFLKYDTLISIGFVSICTFLDYFFFRKVIYNYSYALWLCCAICVACTGVFVGITLFVKKEYKSLFKTFWLSFIPIYLFIMFISFVRAPGSYEMTVNLKIGDGTFQFFKYIISNHYDRLYISLVCIGNLLIFLPLPFIMYALRGKIKAYHIIIGLLFPLIFEGYQYLLKCGNVDIDDIILNWCGFFIGLVFLIIIKKKKLTPTQNC
jgi:glycopeptide antibiotics resistance protein